jgi:TPR repeat protein
MNLYPIVLALSKLERFNEIIPYANQYLEYQPGTDEILMRRGVAFWKVGRNTEAYADFLASAKMGNAFSQNKVGWFLSQGLGVAQDMTEAVAWWQKAAANGDKDGINNVREAKARGLLK